MKSGKILVILVVFLGLMVGAGEVEGQTPIDTAFTYQGWLMDDKRPADDFYDFEFRLYDANVGGTQEGNTIDFNDLRVTDGYFTVRLDFGNVFDGNERWLEITAAQSDGSDPCTLSPRMEVTLTPYALYTLSVLIPLDLNSPHSQAIIKATNTGTGPGISAGNTSSGNSAYLAGNVIAVNGYANGPTGRGVQATHGTSSNWAYLAGQDSAVYAYSASGLAGQFDGEVYVNGNVGIGTSGPDEELHIVGSLKIEDGNQGANKVLTSDVNGVASWQSAGGSGIPSGVIVMWSGLITDIPEGWALCDGNNSTPDLTSKFIRSVPNALTDPGATGGSSTHTHNGGSYTASSHTHAYSGTTSQGNQIEYCNSGSQQVPAHINHTHSYSGTTGSGGGGSIGGTSSAASSLPPYFELAFIMYTGNG